MACGHATVTKPVCTPCRQQRSPAEEIRALGAEALTIDVVVYAPELKCISGDARRFTVWVDDNQRHEVELPCYRPPQLPTITLPVPGYDGGSFVVDEGTHVVRVVDDDTHHGATQSFAVPHLELSGDGLTLGNHVNAYADEDAVRLTGPMVLRPWRV
jgi:hypothetical protein